jgi:hypothetical protein
MLDPKAALVAGLRYLRRHPDEILRNVKNASRLRFGIPVVALQWLAKELESSSAQGPKAVEIHPSPPGLRVTATLEQMGTLLRGSCVVIVERVIFDNEQARVELRLRDVSLKLLDESVQTPLAALIRSGTLDLTRVASLVAYLPSRPSALVEAVDDRLVLDLMKGPAWAKSEPVRKVAGLLSSLFAIDSIETDIDHLDVSIRALPHGISGVLRQH